MTGQVLDTNKYKYKRIKVRGKDGTVRYSAGNGDAVARAMFGMDKDAMIQVMQDNGLAERLDKHTSKNAGHLRMILGQALRGVILRGQVVTIRDIKIKALSQPVPLPRGFTEMPIKPRMPKEQDIDPAV